MNIHTTIIGCEVCGKLTLHEMVETHMPIIFSLVKCFETFITERHPSDGLWLKLNNASAVNLFTKDVIPVEEGCTVYPVALDEGGSFHLITKPR